MASPGDVFARPTNADATTEPTGAAERFRVYVEPELPVLLRVARRFAPSGAEAEDLVQETLIRAYRAIERFDGRHPRAWLLTILRNTAANMARRRRPELADDADIFASVRAHGEDGRAGPQEQLVDGVLDEELERALAELSSAHRAIVALVDVDGLSYQEAAEVLDVPVGTVMSRLHRARRRLRAHLEEAGFTALGRVGE